MLSRKILSCDLCVVGGGLAGTWNCIKNSGKFNAANLNLDSFGFFPGKRKVEQEFDKLILVPVSTWGNDKIDLISFDFA